MKIIGGNIMKDYFEKDETQRNEIESIETVSTVDSTATPSKPETLITESVETISTPDASTTPKPKTLTAEPAEKTSAINNATDFQVHKKPIRSENKTSNLKSKTVAACLVATFAFGSLGLGLGLGLGAINEASKLLSPTATNMPITTYPAEITAESPVQAIATVHDANALSTPDVVESIIDAVVSINVTVSSPNSFFNRSLREGSGSGIIFSEDEERYYIVTNNHVIDSANKVTVSIDDDIQINANYVGGNAQNDIAVISALKSEFAEKGVHNVTIAPFGNSDALRLGEAVIAIGNALGEGKSVTGGFISALNRTVTIDGSDMILLQTDAAINPGNSGGPLITTEGKVIGINTAKFSNYSVEGMGFSIPINTVATLVEEIMESDTTKTPFLGISGLTMTDEIKGDNDYPDGVIIIEVFKDTSAAEAGMKVYDIVTEYEGKPVTSMEEFAELIKKSEVGDRVRITVYRESSGYVALFVTLGDMNSTRF